MCEGRLTNVLAAAAREEPALQLTPILHCHHGGDDDGDDDDGDEDEYESPAPCPPPWCPLFHSVLIITSMMIFWTRAHGHLAPLT